MGINPTTTSAHGPQSSRLSKRVNRTLMNKARALIDNADLKETFWSEGVLHSAYIHNRTMNTVSGMKTPYEVLLKQRPDNSNICIFGCEAFAHVHEAYRISRMDDRETKESYFATRNGPFQTHKASSGYLVETKHVSFNKKDVSQEVYSTRNRNITWKM